MKKVLAMCVFVVAFFTLALGSGLAGKGQGKGQGQGIHDGGGLQNDLWCTEEYQQTITGTVLSNDQGCLVVETDNPNKDPYMVWGLGPNWYWLGVEKPTVGEDVTITIANCNTDGPPKYFAISITFVDETMVGLRDPETCNPLWR